MKIDRTIIFAFSVSVLAIIFIIWGSIYICHLEKMIIENQAEIEIHKATEEALKQSLSNNYE